MNKAAIFAILFFCAGFGRSQTNWTDWAYGRPGVRVVTNAPSYAELSAITNMVVSYGPRISLLEAGTSRWETAYSWGDWSPRISGLEGKTSLWNTVSAKMDVTGGSSTNQTLIGGTVGDFVTFSPAYTTSGMEAVGSTFWDADNRCLTTVYENGVRIQHGSEGFYEVQNDTGATVADGTLVMWSGEIGNSGNIRCAPAVVTIGMDTHRILGFATSDITNGAVGKVTWWGKVRGIDTTGQGGETWSNRVELYASTNASLPGSCTALKPQAPWPAIRVGKVVNTHHSTGTIEARVECPVRLVDCVDVNGTPLTQSGQFPVWDQTRGVFDFDKNIITITNNLSSNLVYRIQAHESALFPHGTQNWTDGTGAVWCVFVTNLPVVVSNSSDFAARNVIGTAPLYPDDTLGRYWRQNPPPVQHTFSIRYDTGQFTWGRPSGVPSEYIYMPDTLAWPRMYTSEEPGVGWVVFDLLPRAWTQAVARVSLKSELDSVAATKANSTNTVLYDTTGGVVFDVGATFLGWDYGLDWGSGELWGSWWINRAGMPLVSNGVITLDEAFTRFVSQTNLTYTQTVALSASALQPLDTNGWETGSHSLFLTSAPPQLVTSVIGRTGDVSIVAADIGAVGTNDASYLSIPNLVPYTGASADVDLGEKNLSASNGVMTGLLLVGGASKQNPNTKLEIQFNQNLDGYSYPMGFLNQDGIGGCFNFVSWSLTGIGQTFAGDVMIENGKGGIVFDANVPGVSPSDIAFHTGGFTTNPDLCLKASGNVLIGKSRIDGDDGYNKLQVSGGVMVGPNTTPNGRQTAFHVNGGGGMDLNATGDGGECGVFMFGTDSATQAAASPFSVAWFGIAPEYDIVSLQSFAANDGEILPITFCVGPERMRITPLGNLLVGSTVDDEANKLQVSGSVKASDITFSIPKWIDEKYAGVAIAAGGTAPALTAVESGSVIKGMGFDQNDEGFFSLQWAHGTASTNAAFPNLYYTPHVHISAPSLSPPATNATFVLQYRVTPVGSAYGATVYLTNTVGFAAASTHTLLSFGVVTNNILQGRDSVCVQGRIARIPSASDDYGATRLILDSLDYHIPIDSVGSVNPGGDAP